jgi:signal transduction histidine kinase
MSLYPLVPLLACIICAVVAIGIYSRGGARPETRLAALMLLGPGIWSFCEVMWAVQDNAEAAMFWMKMSSLGWAWLGPVALHFSLELTAVPAPKLRHALPLLYGLALMAVVADFATPWFHAEAVKTSWGWAYTLGPALPFFYAFSILCIGWAVRIGWASLCRLRSSEDYLELGWVSTALIVPIVAVTLGDAVLPYLDIQLPRVGTLSFALLGILILWTFQRYENSFLAAESYTSEILETLPDGVAMVHLDGRIRSANGALLRLLDARPEEVAGLRLTDHVSEPIHPTDQPMERQCDLRTLKGDLTPIAISSMLLRDRLRFPVGLVVVIRDLNEVEGLRDRLLLSGRLAAVGELAAGIAHEINNPLAFVRANVGLLRQHWLTLGDRLDKAGIRSQSESLLSEGEELIEESIEGVDRAAAIVRDVRGLAHGGKRERTDSDLNVLLEGVLRIAAPQLRGRIEVETDFREVPCVFGAPQELQQVFLNLILNASQAIEERGTVKISTEQKGDMVIAHIEDDGCGISPEIRDRIFDPFFTTKAVGEGTGLGLGIAYGIVKNHGGDITIESDGGRGTCFSVHLPAVMDTLDAF